MPKRLRKKTTCSFDAVAATWRMATPMEANISSARTMKTAARRRMAWVGVECIEGGGRAVEALFCAIIRRLRRRDGFGRHRRAPFWPCWLCATTVPKNDKMGARRPAGRSIRKIFRNRFALLLSLNEATTMSDFVANCHSEAPFLEEYAPIWCGLGPHPVPNPPEKI